MASYTELFALRIDSDLVNKVTQGDIDGATPTSNQLTWADAALSDPQAKAKELINYLLASNKDLTKSQIEGASDAAIQAKVDSAVDVRVSGGML